MPWESRREPEPDREYLVLATHLPLKSLLSTVRFARAIRSVQKQLERTDGVIGYSLRAQPLRRDYRTLSVWEGDRALMAFVRELPHRDVMARFAPSLGAFRYVRWKVPGTAAKPEWEDALRRLDEAANGRS
jgi:hypothetical protein